MYFLLNWNIMTTQWVILCKPNSQDLSVWLFWSLVLMNQAQDYSRQVWFFISLINFKNIVILLRSFWYNDRILRRLHRHRTRRHLKYLEWIAQQGNEFTRGWEARVELLKVIDGRDDYRNQRRTCCDHCRETSIHWEKYIRNCYDSLNYCLKMRKEPIWSLCVVFFNVKKIFLLLLVDCFLKMGNENKDFKLAEWKR